jgi:hypothetical protein
MGDPTADAKNRKRKRSKGGAAGAAAPLSGQQLQHKQQQGRQQQQQQQQKQQLASHQASPAAANGFQKGPKQVSLMFMSLCLLFDMLLLNWTTVTHSHLAMSEQQQHTG